MLCTAEVVPPTIKKSVGGPESIGGQFFCVAYDGNGMTEIVQRLHGIDVHAYTLFAEQPCEFRIAASAFMTRDIKGDYTHF